MPRMNNGVEMTGHWCDICKNEERDGHDRRQEGSRELALWCPFSCYADFPCLSPYVNQDEGLSNVHRVHAYR